MKNTIIFFSPEKIPLIPGAVWQPSGKRRVCLRYIGEGGTVQVRYPKLNGYGSRTVRAWLPYRTGAVRTVFPIASCRAVCQPVEMKGEKLF